MKRPARPSLSAILSGGLVAGTLDIGSASLINWIRPAIILRAVASGLLGPASFHDGFFSAVLGLFLQWVLSILIAALFVGAALRIRVLLRHWILAGLLYGGVVFVVMNYIVVPLSRAPFGPSGFTTAKILENLAAMLLFGWIVAAFARLFLGRRDDGSCAAHPGSGD